MTVYEAPRHRVFISFHHDDQAYKDRFVQMMGDGIVDESVDTGDIDDTGLKTARVRQKIRDEYIRDASVTIVLIGPCTWQRKHVDWEIGSSLRATRRNPRCGLLGILLPNHPDHGMAQYKLNLIPPRLADNVGGGDPYALVYDWSYQPSDIRNWIHKAFQRRDGASPNNGRDQFRHNRSGDCSRGWQG